MIEGDNGLVLFFIVWIRDKMVVNMLVESCERKRQPVIFVAQPYLCLFDKTIVDGNLSTREMVCYLNLSVPYIGAGVSAPGALSLHAMTVRKPIYTSSPPSDR
jgi:hypothetical protein